MEIDNKANARLYYEKLLEAIEQKDYTFIENDNPPDDINWTHLPQLVLDEFEELYGRIGELLEVKRSGGI